MSNAFLCSALTAMATLTTVAHAASQGPLSVARCQARGGDVTVELEVDNKRRPVQVTVAGVFEHKFVEVKEKIEDSDYNMTIGLRHENGSETYIAVEHFSFSLAQGSLRLEASERPNQGSGNESYLGGLSLWHPTLGQQNLACPEVNVPELKGLDLHS